MADTDAPTKYSKIDFSRNVSFVLGVPIGNGGKETTQSINNIINQLGNSSFEFPPSVSKDKPYLLSLIFKTEEIAKSKLALLQGIEGSMASGKFDNDYHTLKTQCLESEIYSFITKCIKVKQHIKAFLFSKPIEGKIHIKLNATSDQAFNELLKHIPFATPYKTHSHLAFETELIASVPLSPKIHENDSKIPPIIEQFCKAAGIEFKQDNIKIIRKQGKRNNIEYISLKAHYTCQTKDDLEKLLNVSVQIQTPAKLIWRSMDSVAAYHRNEAKNRINNTSREPPKDLSINTGNNILETRINILDTKVNTLFTKFDSLESKLDKICNAIDAGTFANNNHVDDDGYEGSNNDQLMIND